MRPRRRLPEEAPTRECYAGFQVGQHVTTRRRPYCGPVSGIITRIVLAPFWTFAAVQDADGSHACGLDELA